MNLDDYFKEQKVKKENITRLLKEELLKLKGVVFKKFDRDIIVDFKIANGHLGIDIIFEDNNPNWWNIYWYMKMEGGIDEVKELNRKLNKSLAFPKGYYHIVGSATYTDKTWSKMNGATITIMI